MAQTITTTRSTPRSVASALVERADRIRIETSNGIAPEQRGPLGQFTTPIDVASFMTGMVRGHHRDRIRLLDPGAGTGSLTAAFVAQQLNQATRPKAIAVTAYEIDAQMASGLMETLAACEDACQKCGVSFAYDLRKIDYIRDCAERARPLWPGVDEDFDCVIMNPPYRKINSQSETRHLLRSVGVETSNLYSAFMLLAARQLAAGGEFVSITPRSFCNGPYFQRFRGEFLSLLSIDCIHVFESRTDTFREDAVLQENVILHGTRSNVQADKIVISNTMSNGERTKRSVASEQVVRRDDRENVIHIVVDDRGDDVSARMLRLHTSLDELGFKVSTGRVVDFRAKEYLRPDPADDTVPLIFPAHIKHGRIEWPNGQTRKPNAIVADDRTSDLLVPTGFYVLIKRFSAKEERRRVVAALFDPSMIGSDRVGFDNKTNYIHTSGNGLRKEEAVGLTMFLNCSLVDEYFRLFSGHTQVNAADLRRLPYPTRDQLVELGRNCESLSDQQLVDQAVEAIV